MDAALNVPGYQLQTLIPNVLSFNDIDFGLGGAKKTRTTVTCAQAFGRDIIVGCSDGSLIRYSFEDGPSGSHYTLSSQQNVLPGRSIDQIALAPSTAKAVVLCDRQVFFYTLPSLDPVAQQLIKPVRNILTFALDELQLRYAAEQTGKQYLEPIGICFVKRGCISLWTLREKLYFVKDVPLPQGALMVRRTGNSLCTADPSYYNLVEVSQSPQLLPILPLSQAENTQVPPSITLVNDCVFLLLSFTGASTLGVFISSSGDPAVDRPLLEWSQRPIAMCADLSHVVALLPDKTLEIHNVDKISETLVQTITPAPLDSFDPHGLAFVRSGFPVPSTQRMLCLERVSIPLIPTVRKVPKPPTSPTEPSGSGLTPPTTPSTHSHNKRRSVGGRPKSLQGNLSSFPRSRILVIGSNSIHALMPSTLISQAETLLEHRRTKDVAELAELTQQKLSQGTSTDPINETLEDLRYIYQKLGHQCLYETQFDEAGEYLFRGDSDPRLLIRLFPDLRGSLISPEDEVDIYSGIETQVRALTSINDIVLANLVRNYSPHLRPNDTQSAASTSELRNLLEMSAREMLLQYLRNCRNKRRQLRPQTAAAAQSLQIDKIINTVLAKLLVEWEESAPELSTLLDETAQDDGIVLNEVEPLLVSAGKFNELSRIYERRNDDRKLLELWTKVADGEWKADDMSPDLIPRIATLLMQSRDRALVQRYSLWLIKRDPEVGLKILTMRGSSRRSSSKSDDGSLLAQIRAVDPSAGAQFLEHVVLIKKNLDPEMHMQLVTSYLDQLLGFLQDGPIAQFFLSAASDYVSQQPSIPFLSYLAFSTPDSEYKRVRLKTALFLQGSEYYDAQEVYARLAAAVELPVNSVLKLELTIVRGKLGHHREALSVLVHDLQDPTTAESYCTLGGKVVSGKVAHAIGEKMDLSNWANIVTGGQETGAGAKSTPTAEGKKRELLRILMEVYMSGGEGMADLAARLLNSQAINLDVEDVIALVPATWSLEVIASFLARSFRRTLHALHEGQITKAISAGQNLEVSESTWLTIREQGAVLEEQADGDNPSRSQSPSSTQFEEKEKVGVDSGPPMDIVPGSMSSMDLRSRKEGYDLQRDTNDTDVVS